MGNQSTGNGFFAILGIEDLVIYLHGPLLNRRFGLCRSSCRCSGLLTLGLLFLNSQIITNLAQTLLKVPIIEPHQQLKTVMISTACIAYAATSQVGILEQAEAIFPAVDRARNMTTGFTESWFKMGR